jgi:glycerophosphoryl diester phosphodiesterase
VFEPIPHIRVHGHRGARARLPENTIAGFEYAIRQGVDALEMDLAVTKDDIVVISHDPLLHHPICTGPRENALIRDLTLAELRQWDCGATKNPLFPHQQPLPGARIPTLEEAFQWGARGTFDFHLELKSFPDEPQFTPAPDEFARMVLDVIRCYGMMRRVAVLSFDFRTLRSMRQLAPEVRLSALTEADSRDFAAIAEEAGNAEIVSPEVHLVTPQKVDAAHRAGLQVVAWTANTAEEWDTLIEAKVDAVVTDDPAALIVYLQQRELR